MQFLGERIGRILEELRTYIQPKEYQIKEYKILKAAEKDLSVIDDGSYTWDIFNDKEVWGGHREYFWFDTEITIPDDFDNKCVTYELITGREEAWDALNPQFKIFINGKLVQGLDVNHRDIILTTKATKGESYRLTLSAFTGDENYHLMLKSKIAILDKEIERLYYDLTVPYEVAKLINKEEKTYIDIIGCINEAVNIIDLRQPFSSQFYESIDQAQAYITEEFYNKRCGVNEVEVYCVGHTHIDVAWLWTLGVTRDKVVRSFSTVLEHMKMYPEYLFMSSQPQLYKYVKEDAPELYEEIRERIKEGRWEAEGGMFVEADCNVASGEALIRQIIFGKRFFKDEFNVDNKILWLPDVFGYSAALPQILQKSGIPYFMTTKISWNEYNKLPYDTFIWKGIDGSKVLTHFIPASDYQPVQNTHFTTYNGKINPSQIKGAWQRYQQKNLNEEVLFAFGYGDGGGGPTKEMFENHRRLNKGIPGCPKTVMSTSRQFFDKLQKEVEDNKYLPTWAGELYLEYHRGTYTTMAKNKKYNRKLEFMYQNLELFSTMDNKLLGQDYPQVEINEGWEVILRNQFHDILPGSSIKEVYEESDLEYKGITKDGNQMINEHIDNLTSHINSESDCVVVWNPLGFTCSDIVSFEIPEGIQNPVIYDKRDGLAVICQKVDEGKAIFFAQGIPAKGYKSFILKDEIHAVENEVLVSKDRISNKFFDIQLDGSAHFTSIYDKIVKREVLKEGEKANVIMSFEDKPHNWDAWDINVYYKEKMWVVDDVSSIEIKEQGPVRFCIRIKRNYLDSTIVQHIYTYKDIPRIDIKNNIDWKEKQILLKAVFPVDVHTEEATFDIQYGNVTRATHYNTSWDQARFEVCTHKWADVSEDNYGVSLINDCKYGYNVHDGVIGISLLKSPTYPNPDADKEQHEFVYAIYPHEGSWKSANTVQHAYSINNPMFTSLKTSGKGKLPTEFSFVEIDAENVVIEIVKKAEDSEDIIVRLYECYNRRTNATVDFSLDIKNGWECDLLENNVRELEVIDNKFAFEIKPYEIKTFKVKIK